MRFSRAILALAAVAVLSLGAHQLDAAIESWSTTASSNNSAAPDGFPEGMAPGDVNDSAREVMAQVRRFAEQQVFSWYGADGGGDDTYTVTPSIAVSAYTTGQLFVVYTPTANTATATLEINSLGAKDIVRLNGATLTDGDFGTAGYAMVTYDGITDRFRLISNIAGSFLVPSNNLSEVTNAATARANISAPLDVITTEGDLVLGNSSGEEARLALAASGLVLASNGTTAFWNSPVADKWVQVVHDATTAALSGTEVVPQDDTVPADAETFKVVDTYITPAAAANRLLITAGGYFAHSAPGSGAYVVMTLHQDGGAAIASGMCGIPAGTAANSCSLTHEMAAGGTSLTNFELKAGGYTAGTTFVNTENNGTALYGGTMQSWIAIEETQP